MGIKLPDIDKNIKKLVKKEDLFKSFPIEVTAEDKLITQGPKLWQATTEKQEQELAKFEKENQLAINAIKAKVEDPLKGIMQ